MSFMYNPYPYDDLSVVNKPELDEKIVRSVVSGTNKTAVYLSSLFAEKLHQQDGNLLIAFDGYITAQWTQVINLISQHLSLQDIVLETVDFASVYKSGEILDSELSACVPVDKVKDPVSLFGKIYNGGYESLFDADCLEKFSLWLEAQKAGGAGAKKIILIYGYGCTIQKLRPFYDLICYFDVTPKESILRIRRGYYKNLGDKTARPVKETIRRCYYVDFEQAIHLRGELLKTQAIDYYLSTDRPDDIQLIPKESLYIVFASLARYPMRCKPVYLEGVWGGSYVKALRKLPAAMRNCAWVFDLIPMEVSIVVEAGQARLEFPFFTFVQTEGVRLMGQACVDKFKGYFPIRFNYDDTYHSNGNMSIQVHSGHDYNIENFNELGRQDESYYVVATGHNAKTYVGFTEESSPQQFIDEVKISEKDFTPVDYQKYIHAETSKPGLQVLLPAGTIHSSGRNQVVLEIGSLTVGSYTYKLYDYLRSDLDGIPRPIHTWHGERVVEQERTASWVKENLVQAPRLVRASAGWREEASVGVAAMAGGIISGATNEGTSANGGEDWAEYIVGEHDLLYFSLRRLEFTKTIGDNTNGVFHVLTLVDGERVKIRSVENPDHFYIQNFMDIVIVPANMGSYVIENLGDQPVCVHKTMLKEGFVND